MKIYRVRMPRLEENRLELLPLSTALLMEQHLEQVAAQAAQSEDGLTLSPRELRCFQVQGSSIFYEVDLPTRTVQVSRVSAASEDFGGSGCRLLSSSAA